MTGIVCLLVACGSDEEKAPAAGDKEKPADKAPEKKPPKDPVAKPDPGGEDDEPDEPEDEPAVEDTSGAPAAAEADAGKEEEAVGDTAASDDAADVAAAEDTAKEPLRSPYPIEGIIAAVTPKVLDKPDAKPGQGVLKITATNGGLSVDGHVRVALYEPGAHPKVSKPVVKGRAGKNIKVNAATYDIYLRHKASKLANETGWIRKVTFGEKKVLLLQLELNHPIGRLQVKPTNHGEDVSKKTSVSVFATGTANQGAKPLASFRADKSPVVSEGRYDLRLTLKESRKLKVEHWVRGQEVRAAPEPTVVEAEIPLDFSFVMVKATNAKTDLEEAVRVRFFESKADPDMDKPVLETKSGKKVRLVKGTYDVELVWALPHGVSKTVWKKKVKVKGERDTLKIEKDFKLKLGRLEVIAKRKGRSIGKKGKVLIFKRGKVTEPFVEARTLQPILLPKGTYDVQVRYRGKVAWARKVKLKKGANVSKTIKLR